MKIKCTCKHEMQDTLHGKGIRVFNKLANKQGGRFASFKCTVCGNTTTKEAN